MTAPQNAQNTLFNEKLSPVIELILILTVKMREYLEIYAKDIKAEQLEQYNKALKALEAAITEIGSIFGLKLDDLLPQRKLAQMMQQMQAQQAAGYGPAAPQTTTPQMPQTTAPQAPQAPQVPQTPPEPTPQPPAATPQEPSAQTTDTPTEAPKEEPKTDVSALLDELEKLQSQGDKPEGQQGQN